MTTPKPLFSEKFNVGIPAQKLAVKYNFIEIRELSAWQMFLLNVINSKKFSDYSLHELLEAEHLQPHYPMCTQALQSLLNLQQIDLASNAKTTLQPQSPDEDVYPEDQWENRGKDEVEDGSTPISNTKSKLNLDTRIEDIILTEEGKKSLNQAQLNSNETWYIKNLLLVPILNRAYTSNAYFQGRNKADLNELTKTRVNSKDKDKIDQYESKLRSNIKKAQESLGENDYLLCYPKETSYLEESLFGISEDSLVLTENNLDIQLDQSLFDENRNHLRTKEIINQLFHQTELDADNVELKGEKTALSPLKAPSSQNDKNADSIDDNPDNSCWVQISFKLELDADGKLILKDFNPDDQENKIHTWLYKRTSEFRCENFVKPLLANWRKVLSLESQAVSNIIDLKEALSHKGSKVEAYSKVVSKVQLSGNYISIFHNEKNTARSNKPDLYYFEVISDELNDGAKWDLNSNHLKIPARLFTHRLPAHKSSLNLKDKKYEEENLGVVQADFEGIKVDVPVKASVEMPLNELFEQFKELYDVQLWAFIFFACLGKNSWYRYNTSPYTASNAGANLTKEINADLEFYFNCLPDGWDLYRLRQLQDTINQALKEQFNLPSYRNTLLDYFRKLIEALSPELLNKLGETINNSETIEQIYKEFKSLPDFDSLAQQVQQSEFARVIMNMLNNSGLASSQLITDSLPTSHLPTNYKRLNQESKLLEARLQQFTNLFILNKADSVSNYTIEDYYQASTQPSFDVRRLDVTKIDHSYSNSLIDNQVYKDFFQEYPHLEQIPEYKLFLTLDQTIANIIKHNFVSQAPNGKAYQIFDSGFLLNCDFKTAQKNFNQQIKGHKNHENTIYVLRDTDIQKFHSKSEESKTKLAEILENQANYDQDNAQADEILGQFEEKLQLSLAKSLTSELTTNEDQWRELQALVQQLKINLGLSQEVNLDEQQEEILREFAWNGGIAKTLSKIYNLLQNKVGEETQANSQVPPNQTNSNATSNNVASNNPANKKLQELYDQLHTFITNRLTPVAKEVEVYQARVKQDPSNQQYKNNLARVTQSLKTREQERAKLEQQILDAGGTVSPQGSTSGNVQELREQLSKLITNRFTPIAREIEVISNRVKQSPNDQQLKTKLTKLNNRLNILKQERKKLEQQLIAAGGNLNGIETVTSTPQSKNQQGKNSKGSSNPPQIAELEQRLSNLKTKLSRLTQNRDGVEQKLLKSPNSNLSQERANLKRSIANCNNEIRNLVHQLKDLKEEQQSAEVKSLEQEIEQLTKNKFQSMVANRNAIEKKLVKDPTNKKYIHDIEALNKKISTTQNKLQELNAKLQALQNSPTQTSQANVSQGKTNQAQQLTEANTQARELTKADVEYLLRGNNQSLQQKIDQFYTQKVSRLQEEIESLNYLTSNYVDQDLSLDLEAYSQIAVSLGVSKIKQLREDFNWRHNRKLELLKAELSRESSTEESQKIQNTQISQAIEELTNSSKTWSKAFTEVFDLINLDRLQAYESPFMKLEESKQEMEFWREVTEFSSNQLEGYQVQIEDHLAIRGYVASLYRVVSETDEKDFNKLKETTQAALGLAAKYKLSPSEALVNISDKKQLNQLKTQLGLSLKNSN